MGRRMEQIMVAVTVWLLGGVLFPMSSPAQGGICARVKLEIEQELTLERTAFDARMTIHNGLAGIDLTEVAVSLSVTDAAGNDASDLFFVDVYEMNQIGGVDGSGMVSAGTAAEIHWLLIPAAGAGGRDPAGQSYRVGATLRYRIKGEEKITEVVPDSIVVQPQPVLTLDYFYPRYVIGDDPFTPEEEGSEVYPLGVRVMNTGFGAARRVTIESAQPVIRENDQGLFVDFRILEAFVNEDAAIPSLLLDFGDIEPGGAVMGRWNSISSLQGEFVSFAAEFTHADEFGGALTSLVGTVRSHFLIHDVLLDRPGDDRVRDFLALDGDMIRVYGSDGGEEEVASFLPGDAAVTVSGQAAAPGVSEVGVSTPAVTGPLYIKINEPGDGVRPVAGVRRADGKRLDANNFWFSRERDGNKQWHVFLHIFDHDSSGEYTVTYETGNTGGVLEIRPGLVDFGLVLVGETAAGGVTAANTGSGPLVVSSVGLDAGSDIDFGLSLKNTLPMVLAPGEELPLTVSFTPRQAGSAAGALEVVSTAGTGRIALSAHGDVDSDGDGLGDSADPCDGRREPDDAPVAAGELAGFPASPQGTCVDQAGDVDYYRFAAGDDFVFRADITAAEPGLAAIVGLYDTCGRLLSISRNNNIGLAEIPPLALPSAGEYFVAVAVVPDYSFTGRGETRGWYQLSVWAGGNPADLDGDGDADGEDTAVIGLCVDDPLADSGCSRVTDIAALAPYIGLVAPGDAVPMDVNGDGDVDGLDLWSCDGAYGGTAGDPVYRAACDANKDGRIDAADLAVLRANYAADQCRSPIP